MAGKFYCKGILYPNGSVEILRSIECPTYSAVPEKRLHEKTLEYISVNGLGMAKALAGALGQQSEPMRPIEFEVETATQTSFWKGSGSVKVRLRVQQR